MKINGESIYNTTYWEVYGEGPTTVPEGAFSDTERESFTKEDIRFTYNPPYIYANVMKFPKDGKVEIKALADKSQYFLGDVCDIEVLGYDADIKFERTVEALSIDVNAEINSDYPVCLKILID